MLKNIIFSIDVLKDSFKMLSQHPLLLFPILLVWVYIAAVTIYFDFYFDPELYTTNQILLIVFGVIFGMCLMFAIAASFLFEFIQHYEDGQNLCFSSAAADTFTQNFFRMLPIIVIWACVLFIITVIQAFFSRKEKSSENSKKELNIKSAAESIGGTDNPTSWIGLGFELLKKIVRMGVFMILPAICWENKGPAAAFRRGMSITRQNAGKFASGIMMTEVIGFLVFLPAGLVFYVSAELNIEFPDFVWFLVILYMGIAFSYFIFIELFFCAELYLWHLRWEAAKKDDELAQNRESELSIDDVPQPHLISDLSSIR